MDEELKDFETELRALHPAALSPRLMRNVEHALAAEVAPRNFAPVRWLFAFALPAAAAVALMFTQRLADPPVGNQMRGGSIARAALEPPLKPVAAENVLVGATDEGVVTLADGTPARKERLQFVDTITWRNPRRNASLTWSVPREEVRFVPISFQ